MKTSSMYAHVRQNVQLKPYMVASSTNLIFSQSPVYPSLDVPWLQTFTLSLPRYIYGEDPDSQNDFHRIVIHEFPEIELDNQTSLWL